MNYDTEANDNEAVERAKDLSRKIPIKLRVKAGLALLDQHDGENRQGINPDTLNMLSSGGCVLGQVFGDYVLGLDALGLDLPQGYLFAFNATYDEMDALKKRWIKELTR